MNPALITALDLTPMVSLEDCRKHLRVTPDDDSPPYHPDDEMILSFVAAAREWVEGYTGLALTPRTLQLAQDWFPSDAIQLPMPPVRAIVSVKYTDGNGDEQTLSPTSYTLDEYQRPGWILPAYGETWPTTLDVVNAVLIQYTAGYSLWSDSPQSFPLPKSLRSAVLLLLGHLYENRENTIDRSLQEIPMGVRSLCDWHKVRKGMA